MYLPSVQVLLLAVVAITVSRLSAQAAGSAFAAPKLCSAADVGKAFCINCKTKAKCEKADSLPVPKGNCTVAGEACTVLANVATCKPMTTTTACTCAKPAQCDAYDPNSVLVCLNGGVTVSSNCNATGRTCVNGACVTPATTTSTASPSQLCTGAADGFVVSKPLCTRAAYCSGGTSLGITDCTSGKYFDMNEQSCMAIPPVPCAGCGTGACPDKSDCSKFHICDGGESLDVETCDADTPVFDLVANECLANGNCTGNANCTFPSTTTAATTTTTVPTTTTTTVPTTTTTPVITSMIPPVPTTTTTPVPTTTTTPVPTTTTTPVPTTTTTPVPTTTTTPVPTTTTTPVPTTTTTPVPTTTTTPVPTTTTTPIPTSTTTTSRPATCTAVNVGRRYPFAGNCKKYWSCRLVATGVHAYVESTCLGELVFNAATGYCDTLANVPSCVVGK